MGHTVPVHDPRLAHVRVFGLDFVDAPGIAAVVDVVLDHDTATAGSTPLLVTPNLDHLVQLRTAEPEVVAPTRDAAFVLPDGQPIVWASGWFGSRLRARLTGSDLFAEIFGRLASGEVSVHDVVVVAPSDEVADGLRRRHPGLSVHVAPFLSVDDAAGRRAFAETVVGALGAERPRHVFVCIAQPKQLLLSLDLLEAWPVDAAPPLCHCVGASPEMYLGIEKRAPAWVQRIGAEFVYRTVRDPAKIKRYAKDLVMFPVLLWEERRRR